MNVHIIIPSMYQDSTINDHVISRQNTPSLKHHSQNENKDTMTAAPNHPYQSQYHCYPEPQRIHHPMECQTIPSSSIHL